MARGKKITLDISPQGIIDESKNLKLIYDRYADLEEYDYKMVQHLCSNVLSGRRTTGEASVRTLIGVVCGLAPDLVKAAPKTNLKLKRLAVHALMVLNEQALAKYIPYLKDEFFDDDTETTLKLAVGLLLISQNQDTPLVIEWFLGNLNEIDVWESAYYNAFTGDLYYDGKSVGFIDFDSVFDEFLSDIMAAATPVKLKRVLTNNDYLDSSLRQLILNHNYTGFEALMETVLDIMATPDNIDLICDIAREINGWSSKCEDDVNDLLSQGMQSDFYPGYATYQLDRQISILVKDAGVADLGYSFKQYLNMLARIYRSIPTYDDENPPADMIHYPDTEVTKDGIATLMKQYESSLRRHPKYEMAYLRPIKMVLDIWADQ